MKKLKYVRNITHKAAYNGGIRKMEEMKMKNKCVRFTTDNGTVIELTPCTAIPYMDGGYTETNRRNALHVIEYDDNNNHIMDAVLFPDSEYTTIDDFDSLDRFVDYVNNAPYLMDEDYHAVKSVIV